MGSLASDIAMAMACFGFLTGLPPAPECSLPDLNSLYTFPIFFDCDGVAFMSNLSEIWAKLPGYENFYEISSHGRLATLLADGRRLRKLNFKTHYLSASLKSINGLPQKTIYIHQFVAKVFIGPRPDGMVIRHLDGNRHNNSVSNLTYGTPQQNYTDTKQHKTHWHENNGRALLTERCVQAIRHLHQEFALTQTALAKAFDVSNGTICAIIKGRNWR